MEKFRPTDKTPFNERLPHAGFDDNFSSIRQLKDSPEKIIRVISAEDAGTFFEDETNLDSTVQRLKTAKALFRDLQNNFGINVVRFNYVIGEKPPRFKKPSPVIYTETDKLYGTKLATILESDKYPLPEEVDEFFGNMLMYYTTKYIENSPVLIDLHLEGQFMYGHQQDKEDKIWLVDVDPLYTEYEHYPDDSAIDGVYYMHISNVLHWIKTTEQTHNVTLSYARSVLDDCISNLLKVFPNKSESILDLKKLLAN